MDQGPGTNDGERSLMEGRPLWRPLIGGTALPSRSSQGRDSARPSSFPDLLRREIGDDFFEARIAAERVPEGMQL